MLIPSVRMGAVPAPDHRLTTAEVARFVSDGYLRFDALVPDQLNRQVLAELPALEEAKLAPFLGTTPTIVGPATGAPLSSCHADDALGAVLGLPAVGGIITSLVGDEACFDHDFVHHLRPGHGVAQHLHPDAIADSTDPAFDIQLFYYPHAIAEGGGGTRFVPGSHLRRVTAATTARYQHLVGDQRFVGPAGTLLVFHHGLWHAGDRNPSDHDRWMYKIRLNPQVPQVRLWNLDDFDAVHNDPDDHVFANARHDSVAAILRAGQPWQGEAARRYDLVERVRLWRHLSGDPRFDADHYLTRLDRPLGAGTDSP